MCKFPSYRKIEYYSTFILYENCKKGQRTKGYDEVTRFTQRIREKARGSREKTGKTRIEQENRRRRWMRLTAREVPNAGNATDGIIAGLR